jgi:spore germination protein YaaH
MFHGCGVWRATRLDTRREAGSRKREVGGGRRTNLRSLIVIGPWALALAGCLNLPPVPTSSIDYWGFTGPWDRRSDLSVERHESALSRVISGWIALDTTSFMPEQLYPDTIRSDSLEPERAMALITSYNGGRFHPEIIRGLGGSPEAAGVTAGAIASLVDSGGYRGVVIDFEGMTTRDLDALLAVTHAVADSVRAHGVHTVVIAVPAGDTAAYPAALLLQSADLIMAVLYDQHWSGSPPGPIAAPEWVARNLGTRVAEVGAAKIVAAFPLYGYRWRKNAETEVISFDDARRLTTMTNTRLIRDHASATLHASSPEGWELWVSDAVLLDTLVRDARQLGVRTFALWRLGLEDPAVWDTIGAQESFASGGGPGR